MDLPAQQPLNNIARLTAQAIAGILSGLQSMHTDAYDEAISCPTEEAARIAVATQSILREEAHLCDVIDPLGGSYYVEKLTNEMEGEIEKVIARIDDASDMYRAAESALVQRMIGEAALRHEKKIESGEEKLAGVNCYRSHAEETGQSETGLVVTMGPDDWFANVEGSEPLRCAGKVAPFIDLEIRDPDTGEVRRYGEEGEICVRSSSPPGAAARWRP